MRRHSPQTRWLPDDCQVCPEATRNQSARPSLAVLFVNQPGENNLRLRRPLVAPRQLAQRAHHGGCRAFGVACAAAEESPVLFAWDKLCFGSVDRVQVGSQQNTSADFALRRKPRQQIRAFRKNRLKFDLQASFGRRGRQEISYAVLARSSILRRQERRVDARQRDQLAEQFFRFAHSPARCIERRIFKPNRSSGVSTRPWALSS